MGTYHHNYEFLQATDLDADEKRYLFESFLSSKRALVDLLTRNIPIPENTGPSTPGDMAKLIRERCDDEALARPKIRCLHNRYIDYKHRIARGFNRLVHHVAKRFRECNALGYVELIQEAFCGLMLAIDRFDPSKNGSGNPGEVTAHQFAAYAGLLIRKSLADAVARQRYSVSLGHQHLKKLANPKKRKASQGSRQAKEPVSQEVTDRRERIGAARRAGKSMRAIAEQEGVSKRTVLLDLAALETDGVSTDTPGGKIVGKDGKTRAARTPLSERTLDRIRRREDETLLKLQNAARGFVSLDAPRKNGFRIADAIPDRDRPSPLIDSERRETIAALIADLDERERAVIDLRFGLTSFDNSNPRCTENGSQSFDKIGELLGVGGETARRAYFSAIAKIKAAAERLGLEADSLC